MANFQYTALTAGGEQVTGTLVAESQQAAARSLDERKLYPMELTEAADRSVLSLGGPAPKKKVRPRDVGIMFGQLADLLRAGVPMMRALATVRKASVNPRLKEVVSAVHDDVAAGKHFADVLEAHPDAFTTLQAAMVRAGERGGFLEDVLTSLATFIERQDELRSRVNGALIYPALLSTIGTLLVVGVLMVLVPRFKPFFAGADDLPAPTIFLFALSDLLVAHWPIVFMAVAAGVFALWKYLQSDAGRRMWDTVAFRVPLAGTALRMVAITRFCRIMGTMLANGVPILQALQISRGAAGSVLLADSIDEATENVRAGEPLAAPLAQSGLFPPEIIEMIAVAEESNQLEKVLVQVADTVERRTGRQVDNAVRLIEPLILVVLAGMILFVAIGLLYPIFTMSSRMT